MNIQRRRRSSQGNSLIEFSLLLPWILFVFTAVFDFGFYTYSFISVENAARSAAVRNAANSGVAADQSNACRVVIEELRGLPNIGHAFNSDCSGAPLTVTAAYCTGTGPCGSSGSSPDNGPAALVTVNYRMPPLFRMPVQGVSSISRGVEMRLRDTLQ